MATNRKCICCGAQYEFCPNCGSHTPSWRRVYDNKECMEIAQILIASRGENAISKSEARKAMEKYPATLEKIFKNDSLTANGIKELFDIKVDKEENNVDSIDESEEIQHDDTVVGVYEKDADDTDEANIVSVESANKYYNKKKKYYEK